MKLKPESEMRVLDMTAGSPMRLILTFAFPLLIGNLFQQVYSLVDTMVAGYFLGDSAIAAIGASASLCALLIDAAVGLNSGYAIIVTQRFGAHDDRGLKASIAGMILLDFGAAVLLTVLSLMFLRPLMRFLNTPDAIFESAYLYIAVICAGITATIAFNLCSAVLQAFGNSRTSLCFLVVSSLLSIALDLLFVAVLHMDVAGAALATVLAQAVSAVLCGAYLIRHYRAMLPGPEDFRVPRNLLANLFTSGLALAMMYCLVDLGSVIYQRANNRLGETIISAHTAARRIFVLLTQPFLTISTASSTFVGQNWGAAKPERIRRAIRQVLILALGWSLLACAVVWSAGGLMVRFTTGTSDPEIISNAVLSLRWHLSFSPVLGGLLILRTAMQAMGEKTAPILSSGIELGMKILSASLLIPRIGFLGTCMTEPITWAVMFLFLATAYGLQRKQFLSGNRTE